jgi:CubicO group peptidase (beta-lactamase class C family)
VQTKDGWQTAALSDVGMDPLRIEALMSALEEQSDHWIHSMLVVKDGKLVFEAYFPGEDLDLSDLGNGLASKHQDFDRDSLHCMASVSKSITSILVGIAIEQGLVGSVQDSMFSYFPEYSHLSDGVKDRMTIEDMLTMSSGLPWSEAAPYDDARNDLAAMLMAADPIAFVLGTETVDEPGAVFLYNSGTTNLLGEIIYRTSGMTLVDYAAQNLFEPLQIESYAWYPFPNAPDMMVASSTLYLRPRDMAKIGQLYLDGGVWNGKRVVAENWVSQSTQESIGMVASDSPVPDMNPAYGYQWWLGTFSTGNTATYFAAGYGGQFIFVLPEPRMVIVFTAGGFDADNYDALLQIVNQFILPATGR